jgi:hypothetical protein
MSKKSTAASWQAVAQSAKARKTPRKTVVPTDLGVSSGGILFLRVFCKLLPSPEETTPEAIRLATWMYCRQTAPHPRVSPHDKGEITAFPIAAIEP